MVSRRTLRERSLSLLVSVLFAVVLVGDLGQLSLVVVAVSARPGAILERLQMLRKVAIGLELTRPTLGS